MASEIGIGKSIDHDNPFIDDQRIILNDDGYYWHLYPYFENAKIVQEYELIDLYGDCEVEGKELSSLEKQLYKCLNDIDKKNDTWKVLTGWREFKAEGNEIYHEVEKSKMVKLINQFHKFISIAKNKNLKLICIGD